MNERVTSPSAEAKQQSEALWSDVAKSVTMRYARGNISAQNGRILTEKSLLQKREKAQAVMRIWAKR